MTTVSEELHRLVELRDKGVLSPAEFSSLKDAAISASGKTASASPASTFKARGESDLRGELRRQRFEIHHPRAAQAADAARWFQSLSPSARQVVRIVALSIIAFILLTFGLILVSAH